MPKDRSSESPDDGEHYRLGVEILYDIKRKVLRFLTYLEIPASAARRRLQELDQREGGRKHDTGKGPDGKDRRRH